MESDEPILPSWLLLLRMEWIRTMAAALVQNLKRRAFGTTEGEPVLPNEKKVLGSSEKEEQSRGSASSSFACKRPGVDWWKGLFVATSFEWSN